MNNYSFVYDHAQDKTYLKVSSTKNGKTESTLIPAVLLSEVFQKHDIKEKNDTSCNKKEESS